VLHVTVSLMGNAFPDGRARLLQATVLLLSAGAMAAGIAFVYLAWTRASLPFGVTGVVMLLAGPPVAVVALLARNSVPWPAAPVSAHSLIDGMHHADYTLWMIRMTRAHVGVAASSAFVVWVCEAFRLTHARDFAVCLTLLIAIAAAGYLPWLARQEKFVQKQRDECRRRLDEIRIAESWFAG
jgi:hypothetical protein